LARSYLSRYARCVQVTTWIAEFGCLFPNKSVTCGQVADALHLSNSMHLRRVLDTCVGFGWLTVDKVDYVPNQTWYRLYKVTPVGVDAVNEHMRWWGRAQRLPGYDEDVSG